MNVESHDGILDFTLQTEDTIKTFHFDFRYYQSYKAKSGNDKESGLYVFKTDSREALPYNHTVQSIEAYNGKIGK